MLTFRVDFNDQTDDGRLVALLRLASDGAHEPRVGDVAMLRDSEGNRCRGRVERIEGPLAYLAPSWDSWIDAEMFSRPTVGVESELRLGDLPIFPTAIGTAAHSSTARVMEPTPA